MTNRVHDGMISAREYGKLNHIKEKKVIERIKNGYLDGEAKNIENLNAWSLFSM